MNMNWITEPFDTSYSQKIMDELSKITDHPGIGGRAAGSPAEHRAADYLVGKFKEIGLKNVTKDPVPVDAWHFRDSRMKYQDSQGQYKEIWLGGHACVMQCRNQKFPLIWAGKGTTADYEGIDPLGKLVLIEINQADDWWINFPAYEAKARGAAGVICMNTGGFGQEGNNVLVSEDICGPSDLFALSIGKQDGAELKELLAASETGTITVTLNVESLVKENGVSYNVWGDIPGTTDETIYIINHYDSYYHTIFDDVQGIGWALGLAKAFMDHGYQPEKTIRFVAHGAEEWGLVDCKYDWAIGAYRQISQIRPQWQETGFAVMNLDGFYAVKGEHKFCIVCTQELYDFVKDAVHSFGSMKGYEIEVNMELTSSTEDFSYTRAGIPSFVAGAYDGCLADRKVLHSSDSGWEAGFDQEAFELFHRLFAYILVQLDGKKLCPINLARRLDAAFDEIKADLSQNQQAAFEGAIQEAQRLTEMIQAWNSKPGAMAGHLDKELHHIYKTLHHGFIRLDWNDEMIPPHRRYQANLSALERAKSKAATEKHEEAAAELSQVDFNHYAAFFSEETYSYFEKQVTENPKDSWGTGLIEHGNENLYSLIHSLGAGVYGEQEKQRLERAKENQKAYLTEAILAETAAAKAIGARIKRLNEKLEAIREGCS